MTVPAQLVAKQDDSFGYVTYVFKRLDKVNVDKRYIMCVMFPNWDQKKIELGDKGYLSFVEIKAGIDKWFDGEKMVPYNYDNVQFLKFIDMSDEKEDHKYIM